MSNNATVKKMTGTHQFSEILKTVLPETKEKLNVNPSHINMKCASTFSGQLRELKWLSFGMLRYAVW
jgi:hypothetical protein